MGNVNAKIVLLCVELDIGKVHKEFSPPFGILVAASVLRSAHYEVEIHHFVADDNLEKNLTKICKGVLAVGFTTMTTSNLLAVIKASKIVKSLGGFVFWGGPHATLLPEIALKERYVDAVLRGEAEANLVEFVKWRLGQSSPDRVMGLCYKNSQGMAIIKPIPPIVSSDKLSHHSFDLLDMRPYLNREEYYFVKKNTVLHNILPYMTSKGCYKNCAFCYNSIVNKGKWRGYSEETVFEEMEWLIDNYDIEGWYFYDDNFFTDQPRAWRILERFNMPSFVELDLARINEEFLERAKRCNIERLYIGAESGSDRILKKIRKGITAEDIRKKIKLCVEHEVNVELSFIVLFPGETEEELQATFDIIDELSQYHVVKIDGPKVYNPYPGTTLYEELVGQGWKAPSTNEEWAKYVRNISPQETGFPITEKHMRILRDHQFIK